MLTNGANLKWTQEGRTANFVVDGDASLTFCKEALFQFQAHVARIEEQVKAQQAAKDKEDETKKASECKGECDVVQGKDNVGTAA